MRTASCPQTVRRRTVRIGHLPEFSSILNPPPWHRAYPSCGTCTGPNNRSNDGFSPASNRPTVPEENAPAIPSGGRAIPHRKHGFSTRLCDGKRVQHYCCKSCKRTFSLQSFSCTQYLKGPRLITFVAAGINSGSAYRQIAWARNSPGSNASTSRSPSPGLSWPRLRR